MTRWTLLPVEPTEEMLAACGNGEAARWAPGVWLTLVAAAPSPVEDEALVEEIAAFMEADHPDDFSRTLEWLRQGKGADHRGDCTKENFTCAACLYETATIRAKALLRHLREQKG